MRTGRTNPWARCGIPALCILLGGGSSRADQAADAAVMPICLKYTYAELPFAGMTPTQVQQLGTLQQPRGDQDKKFRATFASAAAVITGATRHKVRVQKLDYVGDVQAADLVVSLCGGTGRIGWATPGAFGGRPGQIGLYYQCLAKEREEDAILIVAHLLAHYLFDLPDEVSEDGVRAFCPQQNPAGPGCLMGNFFSDGPRRGYYGKFCGDRDHNPAAPVASTLSAKHTPKDSCQRWVNQFLNQNSVPGELASSPAATDRFQTLEIAARSFTRSEMICNKVGTNRRTLNCSASERDQLRSYARKYLDEQLAFMSRDPEFRDWLGLNDVPEAVERVVDFVLFEPVERPSNFDQSLVEYLAKLAKDEAGKIIKGPTSPPGSQAVPAVQGALLDSMVQGVKDKLLQYLLQLNTGAFVITDTPGPNSILPQDERFIETVARDSVVELLPKSGGKPEPQTPPFPGQPAPGEQVAGGSRQVRQVLILAPLPFEPGFDLVESDSHEVVPFATLRKQAIDVISTTLGEDVRETQEIPSSLHPASEEGRLLDAGLRSLLRIKSKPVVSQQDRRDSFSGMLVETMKRLKGQTIGNVVVFLPPGNMPVDLMTRWNELLRWARGRQGNPTQFDVIKFGPGHVPFPVQELGAATGGSIRRVGLVPEVGTCAQQLRSRSFSGAAVSMPQQGVVDLKAVQELLDPQPDQGRSSFSQVDQGPAHRAEPSRSTVRITRLPNDPSSIEIEFEPFQAEEGAEYEIILGLSRPLTGFPTSEEEPQKAPQLSLYRDGNPTDHPFLALDRRVSSPRMLVFRIPALAVDDDESALKHPSSRLPQGIYTPKLRIRGGSLPKIQESSPADPADSLVSLTFSIASSQGSIQLLAGIREPLGFASTRAITSSDREIILEAEAFAGAPVLNSEIRGVVRRTDPSTLASSTFSYSFRDDGIFPDLRKDDGIATARISLPPPASRTSAEYKVFLEMRSTPQSRFISLADPVFSSGSNPTAKKPELPGVPAFQRAGVFELYVRGRQ